jgi:arylsulfatase A-like enzyme
VLAALAALVLAAPASSLAAPPNVVVIMTDDQSVAQMDFMPEVQRLMVDQGTTFENSFTVFPFCCPSRGAYLTGQYPHNNGVRDAFDRQVDNYRALDASETLPVWLKRAGYRTGHFGKYLNGYGKGPGPLGRAEVPRGWDDWAAPVDHTEYRYVDYRLNENGKVIRYGRGASDYQTTVLGARALDFVRDAAPGRRPFFLNFAPVAPHIERGKDCASSSNPRPAPAYRDFFQSESAPRTPAFDEVDIEDKPSLIRGFPFVDVACVDMIWRSQLAALQSVDQILRQIVNQVRKAGDIDRTLFVFTSDNGLLHGQHRQVAAKRLPYEESVKVPLVVRGPGFQAGEHRSEMVTNIDVTASILQATGAMPGADHVLDGRPLLSGERKDLLLEETFWQAIRTPESIYVRYRDPATGTPTGEEELYDLVDDPFELQSLHADPASAPLKASLLARLDQVGGCAGSACP